MSYPENIARCQHIKINGTQCGSPALHRNRFCYFHKRWSDQRVRLNSARNRGKAAELDLPVFEDANSIQVALMQIVRLLATGQMDHKTASLILYALQTASFNLRHTNFEPNRPTKVVINPRDAAGTPLGEDPWHPSMFEEDDEEEDDSQAESGVEIQAVAEEVPCDAVAEVTWIMASASAAAAAPTAKVAPIVGACYHPRSSGGRRKPRIERVCQRRGARDERLRPPPIMRVATAGVA